EEIGKGRVLVNGQAAKASRELREGDLVDVRPGGVARVVVVRTLGRLRGPASIAQTWYEETAESVERRLAEAARQKEQPEPALAIEAGRPTKRDRRQLADWNRWSASLDTD
ncbi:MAG: RNA-binding S4 domain-containing protein, partial [Caldimonas sp.]